MQKPVFFDNKGQTIAATLHMPQGRGPFAAVAMFHGFGSDRNETNFIFVDLARRLEEERIASLRIDFRGSGESEGRFADVTPMEEVSDARAAIRFLAGTRRIDGRRLGAVGMSLGGLVAAVAAGRERRVRSLVLWGAVARPGEIFERLRRKHDFPTVAGGGYDAGGLVVGKRFVEEGRRLDPAAQVAKSRAAVLVVHATADETVPFGDSEVFMRAAEGRGARTRRVAVEGADHTFSGVGWQEEVLGATVGWFGETLV